MKKSLLIQDHAYSDGVFNKKILMCGPPFPPPYGGISVHLKSVKEKFERQGNHVYHHNTLVEYRYRYFSWYLLKLAWSLCRIRPEGVYYHTLFISNSALELRLLIILKRILGYVLVTVDHNCLHLLRRTISFKKRLNRFMPYIDQQVLIGDSTYQSYCDTDSACARIVSVERAFVPPFREKGALVSDSLNPEGFDLFRANHTPLVTIAITRLVFIDGCDLYGGNMAIDVLKTLKKQFPSIGLVCLVGGIEEPIYYKELCARIADYGLEEAVFMINGVYQLWPILQKTDLFLRPTLCDGASVSEDEAHYLGVPVVASDVCLRHRKTITYKSGSLDDCSIKVSGVLQNGIKK